MHAVVVTDRVIDPGVFNRPLAEDPRHRLVILPLADAPYLDAELATQMAYVDVANCIARMIAL